MVKSEHKSTGSGRKKSDMENEDDEGLYGSDSDDQPRKGSGASLIGDKPVSAFLRKTYDLVSAPDTDDIVEWTSDGTVFVVKRVDRFVQVVLPRYFRHKNMRSFVRQLNFYGFRKLRENEMTLLRTGKSQRDSKHPQGEWMGFKHELFRRGHMQDLVKIRRRTNPEPSDKAELDVLRKDVNQLRSQLEELTRSVSSLTELIVTSRIAATAAAAAANSPLALAHQETSAAPYADQNAYQRFSHVPQTNPSPSFSQAYAQSLMQGQNEAMQALDLPDDITGGVNAMRLAGKRTAAQAFPEKSLEPFLSNIGQYIDPFDLNSDLEVFMDTLDFDLKGGSNRQ